MLVAAFSVVLTFGALGGFSGADSGNEADSYWPSKGSGDLVVAAPADSYWP
ncbi:MULTISPECIES: hypothetical protein [Streptomyces]|uniref:Secreted protein n=1 Tax=Streptomyces heilongjiangensis TaxID=945052 RepID=A0ABW1BAJ8_9ACTN|nr:MULTISPECIES: hypothetical protein [Streptomyces]MDC2950365.1 hypothetical protein [Streptomyces heilongjiangensis]